MVFLDFVGVGDATVKALTKNGLNLPEELLFVFPKVYKDTRFITSVRDLVVDKKSVIEGRITSITYKKTGRKFVRFLVDDGTGVCSVVLFKFYPNQISMLENAEYVRCYGKIVLSQNFQMIHPEWAVIKNNKCLLEQKLSAVYGVKKVPDKLITNIVTKLLQDKKVKDLIPQACLKSYNLIKVTDALYYIHALTDSLDERYLSKAKHSVKFEEMLAYKLAEENIKKDLSKTSSPKLILKKNDIDKFYDKLPYDLTDAQNKAIKQILADIKKTDTMVRLLQGDVGAGKTIVATVALYAAAISGYQAAIMAPTEILAEQHYKFLSDYLTDFGIEVIPLLGKLTPKQTKISLDRVKNSPNCIVVGTHAIFQERVEYNNLGLVVVDEQHRFGVEQRLALIKKGADAKKIAPHQLIISATPIPRTLAMTLYGNLELSILDELPPNRKPIVTTILNRSKKLDLIVKLKQAIVRKEQIYWVCPLVEESESKDFLQDVKTLYSELTVELGDAKVGLVYGSMKSNEKIQVMNDFKAAKYDVLVATTVIEVGVDVPNASIMIIDNAERLGISQLHQLRGRVGRGSKESYCVLLYSNKISEIGKKRLSLIRQSQDGFYLAEKDLEIRGAGDILGKEQSGISTFRTFDINEYYDNYQLISMFAKQIRQDYPEVVPQLIARWFNQRIIYVDV
ncbi:ATP-dependent DNA helicase RecG [Allofrancisella guangzhouensis]|uniref:ATP-dependent DNA helicase RecG n=1 Tax=Allofrancisella guangzhouensis TaxID=594679 RepID=A0A0A8E2S8_9GAMM|nr:ATP-dependent DNA helicase RecG [Allofrancisella guangzhouensis]AJC48259.1 ATP-dependent DNA helicase RecG [Allofrancisella guangzhouensis]MBK2027513.1 ATP-dependent DNA helicase RecG [Allofrancisella guangzhouensis]MBK2043748.1 ATP-dependent DNA helicase RecG [Allofrancisella guangzhouensis]MBK2045436.1 ATP-dependent DNA helicase RecG [Allofrancisella guangzhouensis]